MNYRLGSRKTTEFTLLAECCRWNFAGGNDREIPEPAVGTDWPLFDRLCRRHRVQGLAWRCLRERRAALPEPVAASLAEAAATIAEHNLRAARQSALLLDAFAKAGIPLVFIKGLTLSRLAYRDPLAKMSQDIDVLVPGEAIASAAAELQRLGYRLTLPAVPPQSAELAAWHRRRKESVWRSPDGLHLELHSRLADSRELIPGIGVESPRQDVEVAPGIVLPTLARDELFAYLCVHGASSAWFRLKWITDLAGLLNGCTTEQIERLYQSSQRLGAGRAAAQALLLAARTYGTAANSELERRLARKPVHRRLADSAWRQMMREAEPTETRFGTATIHVSQLFLLPGARFKLGEMARQVSDAVG